MRASRVRSPSHRTRRGATTSGWIDEELDAGDALAAGLTLPSSLYTDPRVFERELERIFARAWQYAGHTAQLAEPGSYFTCRAGRIPIVVARGRDGSLRAFLNVCAHRGHPVAQGSGCRRTLQCRYHGWTYDLEGRLRAAPRAERDPSFDRTAIGLRPVLVDTWGPLVFVNADLDAPSLADWLGGLPELMRERGFDLDALPWRARREWPLRCNWKITVDNNTECYHCATVHPGFASDYHVDSERYRVTPFELTFSHDSPPKQQTDAWTDYHLYYVWPNFMLSARGREHFYTYTYLPVGPGETLQVNDYFFPPSEDDAAVSAAIDDLRTLMREDWDVFEATQEGLASGLFHHGRVLAHEEDLLRHVQRVYLEMMSGEQRGLRLAR